MAAVSSPLIPARVKGEQPADYKTLSSPCLNLHRTHVAPLQRPLLSPSPGGHRPPAPRRHLSLSPAVSCPWSGPTRHRGFPGIPESQV